jgi:hypothetical protein
MGVAPGAMGTLEPGTRKAEMVMEVPGGEVARSSRLPVDGVLGGVVRLETDRACELTATPLLTGAWPALCGLATLVAIRRAR